MSSRGKILSPVTGVVFEVLAKTGQTLASGETVLVIESMKMEIPAPMPAMGVITSIAVEAGEGVTQGQPVAEFEIQP